MDWNFLRKKNKRVNFWSTGDILMRNMVHKINFKIVSKTSDFVKHQLIYFGCFPSKIEKDINININKITRKLKGLRNA